MKKIKGWDAFKKLLNEEALELIFDVKNYTNSVKCQICKKIAVINFFTSFRLYKDKERTQFISLHSECAFKGTIFLSDELNEILKSFDYIAEV